MVMASGDDIVAKGASGWNVDSSLVSKGLVMPLEVGKARAKVRGSLSVKCQKGLGDEWVVGQGISDVSGEGAVCYGFSSCLSYLCTFATLTFPNTAQPVYLFLSHLYSFALLSQPRV